jgi:hypothetical protein
LGIQAILKQPPENAQREFGIVKPGENNFKQVVEAAYGKL